MITVKEGFENRTGSFIGFDLKLEWAQGDTLTG
jgi:hypothetical protein